MLSDVRVIRPCGTQLVYARNGSDYGAGRVDETHRCRHDGGHDGPHECATCSMAWTSAPYPPRRA